MCGCADVQMVGGMKVWMMTVRLMINGFYVIRDKLGGWVMFCFDFIGNCEL